MELKTFVNKILRFSNDVREIEKSLIYCYVIKKELNYLTSEFFCEYFKNVNADLVQSVELIYKTKGIELNIYSLVEIFELLVPDDEKKLNGMIYTPREIKDYIIDTIKIQSSPVTICDPACGCGSFLLTAAEYMHNEFDVSYQELYMNRIFGVDIIEHNIEKAAILLRLLALQDGEVITDRLNLYVADSLNCDWNIIFKVKKFDYVIGNPPYVRARNMQVDIKDSLKNWDTCKVGNVDLYIPFYELGLKILKENGKLGYISVNTFITSLNGRSLRNYLNSLGYETRILDFKDAQIFKKVTSYTCITIINKGEKNHKLLYSLFNEDEGFTNPKVSEFSFLDFEMNKPWHLTKIEHIANIKKIQCMDNKLRKYKIRNGLATLKNDIFFFKPLYEDDQYFYRIYNNKEYKIEKEICINIIKPNIIKSEKDLENKMEKGIYPYINSTIIPEDEMVSKFPKVYEFLTDVKEILNKRDKGKKQYPEWYAYGRTQGMNNFGKKLLIPYMAGGPIAVICEDEKALFYCGYAIFVDDIKEMKALKIILESDIFWYYMKTTSKPYSKGFVSFAKNYVQDFGIPDLTEDLKNSLLGAHNKEETNDILREIYSLSSYSII